MDFVCLWGTEDLLKDFRQGSEVTRFILQKVSLFLQSGYWVKGDYRGCEETTEEIGAVVQVVNHGGLDTGRQWR